VSTPATVAPAPAPAPASARSRVAEALPSRWRVATAAALLVAPVALWRFGVEAEGIVGVFYFAVLAFLAVKDVEEQRIPNVIVLPATGIVLLAVAVLRPHHALEALVAALAAAAFLFVPSLLAKGGVGMGDVKLALLLGAALGRGVAAALLLGCLAASLAGVVLLVRHGSGARKKAVPFAPFLAFGAVAAVALGVPHAL
jgi:prepilin signal peptidase PulO-like enzyme (type II secretory pathway)